MKILIIALSGIGDLIMALPMINILKKNYPNSKIDFLVAPRGTKELLENQPFVNKIFVLKSQSVKDLFLNKDVRGLITQLKLNNYDIAITIHPSQGIFSAFLMKLIDAKIRIQHKYNFKLFKNVSWFLTYSPNIEDTHSVYENLNLIKCLKVQYNKEEIEYNYKLTKDEKNFSNNFWKENSLDKYFIVGLHPGTGRDQPWRRWNLNNWVKLIEAINNNFRGKIKFLIFLGPGEIEYEKYFKDIDNVLIVKNFPLKKVISIISKCNFFISNDSGLAHIASLFKIPQIVLFKGGPDPKHTRPFLNKAVVITPKNYIPYYRPYYGFIKAYEKIRKKENEIEINDVYLAFQEYYKKLTKF
ncbi:glycosyltransferase family 9 protein [Methanocaldococcus sp. 10A]